jgi:urea transport system permease protein
MDLVWGYCGILSLGHFAFFGLGGYMIGMWLMYARTEDIVHRLARRAELPPTPGDPRRHRHADLRRGRRRPRFPPSGPSPTACRQLALVVLVPGLLALVFGWLAFRSRVTGVYLSILTQAMTLALSLYLFQNDSGLRGNNGLSGLQNLPGLTDVPQSVVSVWFFWASALALGLGYLLRCLGGVGQVRLVIRGIRDDEARMRFLGYPVEGYKLVVFTLTAVIAGIAGALYYPQAGIINPAEIAPDRVDLSGRLGGDRRARPALWRGHRRGLRRFCPPGSPAGRRRASRWASTPSTGWTGGRCCWACPSCW